MARPRKEREPKASAPRRPERMEQPPPDERKITERQATYLAQVSGVEREKILARPVGQLEEILKWKLDPTLFFFRRVCGRVVRKDPITGVLQGVPNATVHVEDTDCSFLGFFPVEGPFYWWWWFWPVFCRREELATTMTDECGRFCVLIPRWDIDRILRLRHRRICFPEIIKPSIRDILERLRPIPQTWPPIPPGPGPDPPPFQLREQEVLPEFATREVFQQIGTLVGRPELEQLAQLAETREFGRDIGELTDVFDEPAFTDVFPPPLNDESFQRVETLDLDSRIRESEAKTTFELADLTPLRAIGPFLRCRDVIVAEWEYFSDVPDITFRVTQDVDLDSDEETIYSEGFFDVRWNMGSIPNVTLQASPIARPAPFCEGPVVRCGNKPAIVTVGLMPLAATHHDNSTGHSVRVNRPRLGGLLSSPQFSPAQAPYAGTLQLHGCHDLAGAEYYRLLYEYEGASEVPFTGLEWYPPKLTGPPWWFHAFADGDGWYQVLPEAQLVFPNWLLNWPTTSFPNGKYEVRLQLADGSKNVLAAPADVSDPVVFTIDNRAPNASFSQLRWRVSGGAWLPQNTYTWPFVCIVIRRPAGADIQIEVTWAASAVHFRDAQLSAGGCGGGNPSLIGTAATREHWHENVMDNSVTRTTRWGLGGGLPQGSYSFTITAYSRAFNPAGDGGGPGTNWLTNYAYLWAQPSVAVSVIDL